MHTVYSIMWLLYQILGRSYVFILGLLSTRAMCLPACQGPITFWTLVWTASPLLFLVLVYVDMSVKPSISKWSLIRIYSTGMSSCLSLFQPPSSKTLHLSPWSMKRRRSVRIFGRTLGRKLLYMRVVKLSLNCGSSEIISRRAYRANFAQTSYHIFRPDNQEGV